MFPNSSFSPYTVTIAFAWRVTFSKSLNAPVEILLKITFSAARPPRVAHISSSICSVLTIMRSSGRYQAAPKDCPLGTIVTLTKGAACSSNQLVIACPASWKAIVLFSPGVMILFFFSKPPIIRSTASKKSCFPTAFLFLRAAINAASLQTLAISAPEKPGVCFDKKSISRVLVVLRGAI